MTQKSTRSIKQIAEQFSEIVTPELWNEALAEHEVQENSYVERMQNLLAKQNAGNQSN